jgi:cytochrome c
MTMRRIGIAVAAAAYLTHGSAWAAGDPEAGKAIARKCMACHSFEAGVNKVGPSLFGIVGRHSGSIAGFEYSPAMKGFDKTWDEALLNTYLIEPRATVPGTKMIFPGLKEEKDRQDVIAFLSTLK